jgi:hypothetical protein
MMEELKQGPVPMVVLNVPIWSDAASPTAMTESILITRHFHIKCFYITDLINRNEIQIKYCPTEDMIAARLHDETSCWCRIRTFLQTHYEPSI